MGLVPSDYLYKTTPTTLQKNIPPSACQSCRGGDRVVLAQPQVDDSQDTDLQEHEKSLHGKTPFIRANSMIMVPQVEVKPMPAIADTRTRALNLVIWPFSGSNRSVKSNVLYVKCRSELRLTPFC